MPFELNWESPQGACIRFVGVLTPQDARLADEAPTGDPRFDHARDAIGDFSDVDSQPRG